MRKRVLLSIHSNTYFNELFRVATVLKQSASYEPIVLFPHFYPNMSADVGTCLRQGISCLGTEGEILQVETAQALHTFLPEGIFKKKLKNILRRMHLLPFINWVLQFKDVNNRSYNFVLFEILYLKKRISKIARWLQEHNIDLVILGGDLVHYDTACFIRAAHNVQLPVAIVPCTMSNALEMAESYFPIKNYWLAHGYNRHIGKYYPQWVYEHKGRKLLRLPAAKALAMEMLHLAPPKPWINLSGYADAIATESEAMVTYYTREGIPREQLVRTGSIADDVLADATKNMAQYRTELYDKLDLDCSKGLIVSALPPDQLYMVGGRPKCEFATYTDLIRYWIESLAILQNYNVIINLHPSLVYEQMKMFERPGVKIVNQNLTGLIPLCDIFVASVSSVIRWAIACGKPVINYDVYRFRYTDYVNTPGVHIMEKPDAFRTELRHFTDSPKYLQTLASEQRKESHRWGMLDGLAGVRMLGLFDELIEHSGKYSVPTP